MSLTIERIREVYVQFIVKPLFGWRSQGKTDQAGIDFDDTIREDRKGVWEAGATAGRKNLRNTQRDDEFPDPYDENPYREDERTDQ